MDAAFALLGLCVPLLAIALGADYLTLGAIGAVGSLVYTLGCTVSGRLSDRIGYRRTAIMASFIIVVLIAAYVRVDRISQLFVLSMFLGLAMSGYWPPLQAWLGEHLPFSKLGRVLGQFNVAWSAGILLGPAIGGFLFSIRSELPFVLTSISVFTLFLALAFFSVRNGECIAPEPDHDPLFERSRIFLPVAWVANFSTFFTVGLLRFLFPKYASDFGIAPKALGYLIALIGIGQLAMFLILTHSKWWQFRLGPLLAFQVLAISGLLAIMAGSDYFMFVYGILCHGAMVGITFSASFFYSLHTREARGARTGKNEAIVGSGMFLGPILGGIAAENLGPRTPYGLAVLMILAAMLIEVRLLRKKR